MSTGVDVEGEDDVVASEPLDTADDLAVMQAALSNLDTIRRFSTANNEDELKRGMTWGERLSAGYTGAMHGLHSYGPEAVWEAARTVGKIAHSDHLKNMASDRIAVIREERELDPYYEPPDGIADDAIGSSLYEGLNSIASSTYGQAAGGLMALMTGGGTQALAAFGGGAGTMAGLAEYDKFIEQAKKEFKAINPALTDEEIESDVFWKAVLSGLTEGATEGAADAIGAKLVGLFGKAGVKPAKAFLDRAIRHAFRTAVLEAGGEATNAIAQDYIKRITGMQHLGPVASAKQVIGPAMIAGGAFGLAGTGINTIRGAFGSSGLAQFKADADALALKTKEDLIAVNNSPKAVDAYKKAMDSGMSEASSLGILEAVESTARGWAQRAGKEAGTWQGDGGKIVETLQRLEERQTRPQESLPAESLDTVRDFLLSELDGDQKQSLVDAYKQGDGTELVIDPARFDADLKQMLDDPGNLEAIPEAVRPVMESMRDSLVDLYKAADRRALADGFDPALAESIGKTLEYRQANLPPPPPAFTMDETQANEVLTRYAAFKDLSPVQQDALISDMARTAKFNFDGWDMPTDQKAMLGFVEKEMKPFLDKLLKRGERSDAIQEGFAKSRTGGGEQVDLNRFSKFYTDLTGDGNIAESAAVKARELQLAERILLEQATDLADKASQTYAPTDIANWYASMALHQQVHSTLRGVRSEAGHLLRSFNFIKKDPAVANIRAMNVVEAMGGLDAAAAKLNAIQKAESRGERQAVMQESLGAKTLDMFIEYRTLNLLTSLKTHMANTIGNGGVVAVEALARINAQYMGRGAGIVPGEAWHYIKGLGAGLKMVWKLGAAHYQNQGSLSSGVINIDQMFESQNALASLGKEGTTTRKLTRENAQAVFAGINKKWLGLSNEHNRITDGLSSMIEYLGRMLGWNGKLLFAEDQVFKIVNATAETAALVHRRAMQESGGNSTRYKALLDKYSSNVPIEIRTAAMEHAKMTTFQSDLGKWNQAVQDLRVKVPPTRIVVPFFKTPANIIKYVSAHTPGLWRMYADLRADMNSPDLARRHLAEARLMNGTLLWTVGLTLAVDGLLTGRGPVDKNEREKLLATGWQPYSIRIGDDYTSIARFDPIAIPLSMAASMYEVYQAADDKKTLTDAFAASFGAFYRVVSDKSYFQGFADITGLLDGSGTGTQRLLNNLASSSVPATGLVRMVRQNTDPVFREADGMMTAVLDTIPGLSKTLPPRRNFLGEELRSEGYFLSNWASPAKKSSEKHDPVYDEAYRLATVGAGIQGMPVRSMRVGKKAIRLSGAQYSRFLELTGMDMKLNGKTGKEALAALFASKEYQGWDDEKKSKQARKIITDYRKAAKSRLIEEDQSLQTFFDSE